MPTQDTFDPFSLDQQVTPNHHFVDGHLDVECHDLADSLEDIHASYNDFYDTTSQNVDSQD